MHVSFQESIERFQLADLILVQRDTGYPEAIAEPVGNPGACGGDEFRGECITPVYGKARCMYIPSLREGSQIRAGFRGSGRRHDDSYQHGRRGFKGSYLKNRI
jgi:hypothetical protein